jgi:hypothetical protein
MAQQKTRTSTALVQRPGLRAGLRVAVLLLHAAPLASIRCYVSSCDTDGSAPGCAPDCSSNTGLAGWLYWSVLARPQTSVITSAPHARPAGIPRTSAASARSHTKPQCANVVRASTGVSAGTYRILRGSSSPPRVRADRAQAWGARAMMCCAVLPDCTSADLRSAQGCGTTDAHKAG